MPISGNIIEKYINLFISQWPFTALTLKTSFFCFFCPEFGASTSHIVAKSDTSY